MFLSFQGRSYMITGCNSGIGKQTALEIGKRGGTVHMVCRNPETAKEARSVSTILYMSESDHENTQERSSLKTRAMTSITSTFST